MRLRHGPPMPFTLGAHPTHRADTSPSPTGVAPGVAALRARFDQLDEQHRAPIRTMLARRLPKQRTR